MKIVTLLCGIALVLNIALNVYNFATYLVRMHAAMYRSPVLPYVLNEGTWVLAEACLAAFFFILFTRQKT